MRRIRLSFERTAILGGIVLFMILSVFSPQRASAQSSAQVAQAFPDDTPAAKSSNNADAASATNAALLEELEKMRARIEQLEAQLKAQIRGTSAAKTPVPSPMPTPIVVGTSYAVTSPGASPSLSAPDGSEHVPQNVPNEIAPIKTKPAKSEPFAYADWTWLNGNARTKESPMDTKFFTPEIRADIDYIYDFNHPQDDSIGGSSEVFRSNEIQVTQLGVGGDFHYDNVRGRVMTQFGMYSETTPRNDASPARGQWDLDTAYRYVSEAYGGYHINVLHGINVDAGIFMSYIGLFSYYNFDNWAYQPSYVSSNTPWFFNGMRIQIFPTEKLKIEPWIVNGWQSYGRFNGRLGIGAQILYRPTGWFSVLGNQYALGEDDLGVPGRVRYHTDDSIEMKYYDNPDGFIDKMAFSLTGDAGCEHGNGVSCVTNTKQGPKQSFLGFMLYNRWWFHNDKYGFTLGGGRINNPGRYLVLLPPINGATAASGTPYFTENPGDPFKAWDSSATFDYMPSQYITFRWEYDYRAANVPYFTGRGGITPPGGNTGAPGSLVCLAGFSTCNGSPTNTWYPDLVNHESRLDLAILVKF